MYEKVSEKNDLTYGVEKIISVANMYYKADSNVSGEEYLKTYNVFKVGDIAFEGNKSKNYAHGRFVENTIGDGIVSHVFKVFRPKIEYDLNFWKYAINNEQLLGPILVRCTKASTMMTDLVDKDFLRESFSVPTLKEQKEIGNYFHTLDSLITLHRRKCKICKFFSENDWLQRKLRNSWFRVIEAHRDRLILLKKVLKTILIVLKIIRITLFIAKEITEWLN